LGFFIVQAGGLSVMKRTHTCDGITLLREQGTRIKAEVMNDAENAACGSLAAAG
jgi:hypothetical protein